MAVGVGMTVFGDEETCPAAAANGENAAHTGPYADGAAFGPKEMPALEQS